MDDLNATVFSTADFSREDLVRRKATVKSMFPGLGILYELERAATSGTAPQPS